MTNVLPRHVWPFAFQTKRAHAAGRRSGERCYGVARSELGVSRVVPLTVDGVHAGAVDVLAVIGHQVLTIVIAPGDAPRITMGSEAGFRSGVERGRVAG